MTGLSAAPRNFGRRLGRLEARIEADDSLEPEVGDVCDGLRERFDDWRATAESGEAVTTDLLLVEANLRGRLGLSMPSGAASKGRPSRGTGYTPKAHGWLSQL